MKKTKLSGWALVATMLGIGFSACTNETEEVLTQESEIKLTSEITRSRVISDLQSEQLEESRTIGVTITGSKSGDDYVNKPWTSDGEGGLSTEHPVYWANTNVNVTAYHPYNVDWTSGTQTFTVKTDQSVEANYLNSDLLFANKPNVAKSTDPISLTFYHKLAKVNVTLQPEYPEMDLSNAIISICNTKTSTTFNLSDGTVPEEATGEVQEIKAGVGATASAIVAPQTIAASTKFIKVELGEKTFYYTLPSDKQLKSGYSHNYTLTVKEKAIEVKTESEITDWNNEDITGDAEEEDLGYSYNSSTNTYSVWKPNGLYKWREATTIDPTTNLIIIDNITLTTDDIVLNNGIPSQSNWTPVGSGTSDIYIGNINGNNKTISGLRIYSNSLNTGFIGSMNSEGTVTDLILNDIIFYSDKQSLGGVVGFNCGTISNCIVLNGNIIGDSRNVGGVAGYNSGLITNCAFTGSVVGKNENVGGIVGCNFNFISCCRVFGDTISGNENVGGVVGYNWSQGPIMTCSNNASVSGNKNIGGIIGIHYSSVYSSWSVITIEKDEDGNIVNDLNKDGIGSISNQAGRGNVEHCYIFNDTNMANLGTYIINNDEKTYIEWMNNAIKTYNNQTDEYILCNYIWNKNKSLDMWPILNLIN